MSKKRNAGVQEALAAMRRVAEDWAKESAQEEIDRGIHNQTFFDRKGVNNQAFYLADILHMIDDVEREVSMRFSTTVTRTSENPAPQAPFIVAEVGRPGGKVVGPGDTLIVGSVTTITFS
jgi:hypothetical protein